MTESTDSAARASGDAAGEAQKKSEGDPQIIVCQGPPRCDLEGDDAVAAAEAGCVWCRRITIHDDGTETTQEPAIA